MHLQAALTEFEYSKDHTPSSRAWYGSRLGAFVSWATAQGIVDIEALTAPLIRRYVEERRNTPSTRRGQPLSSHTLHGHVRAIRALLNWASREELLDEKIVRRVALPKREQKVLAIFTARQLDLLFRACEQSETPEYVARDKALIAVLLDTGARAAEICDLTIDRTRFTPDEAYLLLNGKGRKQREVPLGGKARQYLHKYIHRARPDTAEQRVFLAKGGAPLTPEGLDRLLYRLRDRAGAEHFTGVRVSAHTMRHTYAVRSIEAGIDVYRLSRLMGHSTVSTTEGYLKALTSRQARQGAASVLDGLTRR